MTRRMKQRMEPIYKRKTQLEIGETARGIGGNRGGGEKSSPLRRDRKHKGSAFRVEMQKSKLQVKSIDNIAQTGKVV